MFSQKFFTLLFAGMIAALLCLVSPSAAFAGAIDTIELPSSVNQTMLSADGETLLYSSYDELFLRNLETGTEKKLGGKDRVHQISRSKDGSKYAVSYESLNVRIWAKDGTLLNEFGLPALVQSLEFSPNGRYLLTSVGQFYPSFLWDLTTGEVVGQYPGSFIAPMVCFLPNGKQILDANYNGVVSTFRIRDLKTGRILRTWESSLDVNSISVSADGQRVVAKTDEFRTGTRSVVVWNIRGRQLKRFHSVGGATVVTYLPNGQLAVGDTTNAVTIYSRQHRFVQSEEAAAWGGADWVSITDVTFSRNGRVIAISNWTNYITIWHRSR